MASYLIADETMVPELMELWKQSFDDTDDAIQFFFDNRFSPQNCAVCITDGRVVSAIHLLPAELQLNGERVPVYYIYAAATLKKYQGRGYMAELISDIDMGISPGERSFSVLLPASESLYDYYGKLGYHPFFCVRQVELNRKTLLDAYLSEVGIPEIVDLSFETLASLRDFRFGESEGTVQWDEKAIRYAVDINRIYGGEMVCVKNGYALCRDGGEGTVEVTEFVPANRKVARELLYAVDKRFHAENYRLRLASDSKILQNKGKVVPFGMIRQEGGGPLPQLDYINMPRYLGLTLD